MRANRRFCLQSIVLGLYGARTGMAQPAYPARVVKVVVPSVPGGATDIIGRAVATGLARRWPQPVVVENRPGAGTSLGAEYVSKAPPDGYTLLIGGIASHAINPAVYRNLGYDPSGSFTPITLIGTLPNVLLARPSFPASNLRQLLDLVRADPGRYSYAHDAGCIRRVRCLAVCEVQGDRSPRESADRLKPHHDGPSFVTVAGNSIDEINEYDE